MSSAAQPNRYAGLTKNQLEEYLRRDGGGNIANIEDPKGYQEAMKAATIPYYGKTRAQLTIVLEKARAKGKEPLHPEAFKTAWDAAPPEPQPAAAAPAGSPSAAPPAQIAEVRQEPLTPAWTINEHSHRLFLSDNAEETQTIKNVTSASNPRSDLGNSDRLVMRFGSNLRYCHPFKSWFIWDGQRWKRDESLFVRELAKEATVRIGDEAAIIETPTERAEFYKWAAISQGHGRIDAMTDLAKSALPITPDRMDANPDILNFPNGTLNLNSFKFSEPSQNDYITKITGTLYNPGATCPNWLLFLNQIMPGNEKLKGNENLISYLQRAAGYSLTGRTGERAIFLCHGSGANGKSTFLNTLLAVMGDYGKPVESATLCIARAEGIRNDLAALRGARFVSATEAGKGKRLDEDVIKRLTGGGDKIQARFLFQEYFEFTPECKIWWSFNSAPRITDTTNSIWDRVKLIPFSYVIPEPERDKKLLDKLLAEAPGIMQWMVDGLKSYQEIGLKEPTEVTQATQNYRDEQDFLGDFFTDVCVIEHGAATGATDLYNAYKNWHNMNAADEKCKSVRSFGFEMGDHGFERTKDRTTGRKNYTGIRLKSQTVFENENTKKESGKS
jgi:putative DNA primase/helicase